MNWHQTGQFCWIPGNTFGTATQATRREWRRKRREEKRERDRELWDTAGHRLNIIRLILWYFYLLWYIYSSNSKNVCASLLLLALLAEITILLQLSNMGFIKRIIQVGVYLFEQSVTILDSYLPCFLEMQQLCPCDVYGIPRSVGTSSLDGSSQQQYQLDMTYQ